MKIKTRVLTLALGVAVACAIIGSPVVILLAVAGLIYVLYRQQHNQPKEKHEDFNSTF